METSGFTKICSSCGELQTYTTKNRLKKSIKENRVCNKCSSVHKKKMYDIDIINQVVKQYVNGISVSKIASILKICKRNIKPILIEKNVWVEGRDKLKKEFSDDEISNIIIKYVNENLSCSVIAKYYGVSKVPINRLLKERGSLREGRSDGKKIELTDEQKYTIKKLYIESHKNSVEIADEIEMNRHFIEKYLHNCNFRRSRGEATSLNQTGKKRSDKVREILKNAQQLFAKSGKRKQMGGVCKKYVIENIECQGTYEKFFIEKLIKENKTLPVNSKSIITPNGVYYPDFEYPQNLIEIKCDYTYEILLGKKISRFTKKIETTQYEKIKWVNEHIKPVEIIVVDKINDKLIKKELK